MRFSHRFASIGRKILVLKDLHYNIENVGLRGILDEYPLATNNSANKRLFAGEGARATRDHGFVG